MNEQMVYCQDTMKYWYYINHTEGIHSNYNALITDLSYWGKALLQNNTAK